MTTTKRHISAIVLAGGQGRRFNYQDKGLVEWKGKLLISHVIDRIAHQADQIIINCNRNIEQYRSLGFPICSDQLIDYQGPLAGIQSALPLAKHSLVLICPCDSVLLPENLVSELLAAMENSSAELAYPICGNQSHYLPVLLKSDLIHSLNDYLEDRDRSMKGWYKTLKAIAVPFSNENASFSNFNNPQDLIP